MTLNLDEFPHETEWSIENSHGYVVASGGPYSFQGDQLEITECLPDDTYTFTILDDWGDGLCCEYGNGSFSIQYNGNFVGSGSNFGSSVSFTFPESLPTDSPASPVTPAPVTPTSPPAPEPAPGPTQGPTPGPTPGPTAGSTTGPTETPPDCSQNDFRLVLTTDNWPGETTWELVDYWGSLIASGGPYSDDGSTIVETACIPDDVYTFTIFDEWLDGICCGQGLGSYSIYYNGELVHQGADFGDEESTTFPESV